MKAPTWHQRYQVMVCHGADQFQEALRQARVAGYHLNSWRDLFNDDVGYGITIVFEHDLGDSFDEKVALSAHQNDINHGRCS